jgi:hypothetical protein
MLEAKDNVCDPIFEFQMYESAGVGNIGEDEDSIEAETRPDDMFSGHRMETKQQVTIWIKESQSLNLIPIHIHAL